MTLQLPLIQRNLKLSGIAEDSNEGVFDLEISDEQLEAAAEAEQLGILVHGVMSYCNNNTLQSPCSGQS
jgi:hypothetical protein